MAELRDYLQHAVEDHASDIFIVAGGPVSAKVEGRLRPLLDGEKVFPPETERLISQIYEEAGRSMERYRQRGDDDFSFAVPGAGPDSGSTHTGSGVPARRWYGSWLLRSRIGRRCTFRNR